MKTMLLLSILCAVIFAITSSLKRTDKAYTDSVMILCSRLKAAPVTLADTCGQYFHFLRQLDRHCQHAKAEVLLSLCAKIE